MLLFHTPDVIRTPNAIQLTQHRPEVEYGEDEEAEGDYFAQWLVLYFLQVFQTNFYKHFFRSL